MSVTTHPPAPVRPASRNGIAARTATPIGRRTGLFLALLISVASLVLLGLVMALSATAAPSLSGTDSAWSLFRSQATWLGVGVVALLVLLRIDYHHWKKLAPYGLGLALLLLAFTAIPDIGIQANGARRWLGVGPVVFQPSELAKVALVIFTADLLSRPCRHIENTRATVVPVLVVTSAMIGLLMLQPHLGATMLVAAIAVSMLYFAGARLRHLLYMSVVGVTAAALMVIYTPWRRERLLGFMNPWEDPLGNGYQTLKSLHAMASGGLDGVGLGAGRAKWGYLPYAHTDFIFAVIGEELGMIGSLFVVVLFAGIAAAGLGVALRASDRFGMLLAVGITCWITIQAALNIGAVLGVLPVVGMTLPLLSFGGTSLVSTLAAMGVLLNVARQIR